MELHCKDFIFITDDSGLTDVSSKTAMESNGWVFKKECKKEGCGTKGCGTANWYEVDDKKVCGTASWYCSGSKAEGSISAKFKSSGSATLDFGNCYKKGIVVVNLNGARKSAAKAKVPSKSINFEFVTGDELKIIEKEGGIINLNSFKVQGEKLNVYCIILSRRIL